MKECFTYKYILLPFLAFHLTITINTCYEFNSLIQFIEWKRVWSGLKCLVQLANDPETQKQKNFTCIAGIVSFCLILSSFYPYILLWHLPRKKVWPTCSRYGMAMALVDPGFTSLGMGYQEYLWKLTENLKPKRYLPKITYIYQEFWIIVIFHVAI